MEIYSKHIKDLTGLEFGQGCKVVCLAKIDQYYVRNFS